MDQNTKGYKINFTIPQGPTGPTGSLSTAYGGLYQTQEYTHNIQLNTEIFTFQLNEKTADNNIAIDVENNTITILESGIYDISFKINLTSDKDIFITIFESEMPNIYITQFIPQLKTLTENMTTIQFRTIAHFQEGTNLCLSFQVDQSCSITSNYGYFIVTKID